MNLIYRKDNFEIKRCDQLKNEKLQQILIVERIEQKCTLQDTSKDDLYGKPLTL